MKLRRFFALFLVLCMLTSVMPCSSFAEGEELLPPAGGVPSGELPESPAGEEELPAADPSAPPVDPVVPPIDPVVPPIDPVPPTTAPVLPPEEEPSPAPSPDVTPAPAEPAEPDDGEDTPVFYNDAYATLQEAIDAVGSGTVTLTADPLGSAGSAAIGEDSSIIIDLNGYMLMDADIQNCGTLTICDGAGGGQFMGTVVNRGHCEFNGDSHESYAGVLNVESGEFLSQFILEIDGAAPLHEEDALPAIHVTGGKFHEVQFQQRYAYDDNGSLRYEAAADCGEITVTGGRFLADPSALLSEDYAAVMNSEGFYEVIVKTWEDELPAEEAPVEEEATEEASAEGDPEADVPEEGEALPNPDGEADPADPLNPDGEADPEDTPDEIVPEEPAEPEEKTLVDLDIIISQGEGTVLIDGESYTKDASIQVAAEDHPVLEVIPDEDFQVANVYLGMNGDSTAYSGVDQIELPVKEAPRMTAMVFFAPTPKYTVTVNYTGNGAVNFDSSPVSSGYSKELSAGDSAELEFIPDTDWFVQNVSVDAVSKGSITALSLDNISGNITVSVTFKQIEEATVTYKNEEGAMLDVDSGLKSGSVIKVHETHTPLTRTGYDFLGWKCALDGELYAEGASYTLPGDVVFTAQWQPVKYTVTYVVNGGTLNVPNPAEYDVSMTPYFLPTDNSVLFKPNAYFRGWYEAPDFSGSALTRIDKDQAGDKTLYARWDHSINVTKSGSGTGTVTCDAAEASQFRAMDYETKSLVITPDAGCVIKKVLVDGVDQGIASSAAAETVDVTPEGADVSVEVIFEAPCALTVHFNAGGKVSAAGADVSSGAVVTIPAGGSIDVVAQPDAYYFMNQATLQPKTKPSTGFSTEAFTVENPGEDAVLTVEFKPQTDVTLTFNADNGTAPESVPAHAGIETTLAPAPVKPGFEFFGWLCGADDLVYAAGAAYTPKDNTAFTAQWTQIYKITYEANGGIVSPSAPESYTALSPAIVLPAPTKAEAIFLGWFTDSQFAESSQIFEIPQGSTGDVTVYAKWERYFKVSVYYTNDGVAYYRNRMLANGESFQIKEGEKATIRFVPTTAKYQVYNVTVNSRRLGSVQDCTVGPATENYLINCTFAPDFLHPITGDDSHIGVWAAVMALSALTAGAVICLKKRRREE